MQKSIKSDNRPTGKYDYSRGTCFGCTHAVEHVQLPGARHCRKHCHAVYDGGANGARDECRRRLYGFGYCDCLRAPVGNGACVCEFGTYGGCVGCLFCVGMSPEIIPVWIGLHQTRFWICRGDDLNKIMPIMPYNVINYYFCTRE